MGDKEISINFSELSRIEVYCPSCNTGILIDLTTAKRMPAILCSACSHSFSDHACTALQKYNEFFNNAVASKITFKFRIKAP